LIKTFGTRLIGFDKMVQEGKQQFPADLDVPGRYKRHAGRADRKDFPFILEAEAFDDFQRLSLVFG
jgi:hypothetical protein